MGRTKYSPEMRNAIMAAFVKAAKAVIDEEGIEAVSIRRVSKEAGYSSATLYLYFTDITELVTMTLIAYLGEYVQDVISSTPSNGESPEEEYRRTWELFCIHAFANPSEYLDLYYGPQSANLDSMVKKYYELFPEELELASGRMLSMLGRGNLYERNRVLLDSLAPSIGLSDCEVGLANDLTLAYFQSFLQRAIHEEPTLYQREKSVGRFMDGAFFILRGALAEEGA